jgi:hypothetical protein
MAVGPYRATGDATNNSLPISRGINAEPEVRTPLEQEVM